ncbi:MAG TPA: hypothetical protein VME46_18780, partial [Acidimicrobiales bacterium]|nr:hypothetical protein [Acidimicrobiales bacterium]
AQFLCDGASTRSVARCAAGGSTTVPAGANFDVIVGGSVLTSGVGTPRWATVDAAATISSSWTPCSADVPCWVAVFINGAVRAPDQSRVDTRWGIGIVTMEPAPVHGEGWVGPFKRESWAARFNDSAVCWDGDQDVGSCQGAGVFAQPATVTLTAHAVPAGGFSVNAAPNDQDPNWSSRFVRWGGDCARAGSDDSCTLRVGTQHSTVQGAEGSFSLSVTAVFEISDPGSGDSGF